MPIQHIGALLIHAKQIQRYGRPGNWTRRDAVQRVFRKKVQETKHGAPSGSAVNLLPIPWLEKHPHIWESMFYIDTNIFELRSHRCDIIPKYDPRKQITELALCH